MTAGLDQTRVWRTFDNANNIYNNIVRREEKEEKDEQDLEPARLYKLNGSGEVAAPYRKILLESVNNFKGCPAEKIHETIQKMLLSEDSVTRMVASLLHSKQEDLFQFCEKPNEAVSKIKVNKLIKEIEADIKKRTEALFFKTDIDKAYLQKRSSVFQSRCRSFLGSQFSIDVSSC